MKIKNKKILTSPSDLNNFVGCKYIVKNEIKFLNKEIQKNNMIIFSKKSLKKGQIISKDDLVFKNVKKNIGADIFNNIEDLVGRKLKQNVSLGFPIRSRHLQLDWPLRAP